MNGCACCRFIFSFYQLYFTDMPDKSITVMAATQPVRHRYVTPTESLDYRLWLARNMGGGYRSIYDRPLTPARAQ